MLGLCIVILVSVWNDLGGIPPHRGGRNDLVLYGFKPGASLNQVCPRQYTHIIATWAWSHW